MKSGQSWLAAGLASLVWMSSSTVHGQVRWQGEDLGQGLERAKQESKFVLLDFYATWCGPCMTLDSVVWNRSDTAQTVAESFVPLRIDADSTQGAAMVRRFGVVSLPMVLVLRADGSELDRLGGAALDADVLYASLPVWKRGETAISVLLSRAERRPGELVR